MGRIIPYMKWKIKIMFETTNQLFTSASYDFFKNGPRAAFEPWRLSLATTSSPHTENLCCPSHAHFLVAAEPFFVENQLCDHWKILTFQTHVEDFLSYFRAKSTDVFHSSPNKNWHPRRGIHSPLLNSHILWCRPHQWSADLSSHRTGERFAAKKPLSDVMWDPCGIALLRPKEKKKVVCIAMYTMTDKSDSIGILSIKLLRILMTGVLLFFSSNLHNSCSGSQRSSQAVEQMAAHVRGKASSRHRTCPLKKWAITTNHLCDHHPYSP